MSGGNPPGCKVALIGAGYTAREHAKAFADVPGVSLAGICSRTRSRAESLADDLSIDSVCGSVAELYDRSRADLVVVTVPELAARAVSAACFSFPWTVLLEKPAGYDLQDALAIRRHALDAGALDRTFVALNRRFYSSTQFVREDLSRREGPRFIKVQDQEDQAAALAAGQPPLIVQNWMYANSIHVIDYFRMMGRGRIARVEPVLPFDSNSPATTLSVIYFDSGDIGLYEGVWNAPAPWSVNIIDAGRRWQLQPLERASFQERGARALQEIDPHPWDTAFKPGFRAQAAAAVAAALRLPSESVSLDDALDTMRLIHAVFGATATSL